MTYYQDTLSGKQWQTSWPLSYVDVTSSQLFNEKFQPHVFASLLAGGVSMDLLMLRTKVGFCFPGRADRTHM